jgi:lysophospholipase L1-like esterase
LKSTPSKLVAGFAITLLFFALLEAASYLVFGRVPSFEDPLIAEVRAEWNTSREYDPLLFWRLQPNKVLGKFKTNSLGLRHPEIPPHEGDEFRILSLGESTTLAANVGSGQSYSARLQDSLGTLDGRRLRVINAGVPGYTLVQRYSFLKHRGLELGLDAAMIYCGFNDNLSVSDAHKRDPRASRMVPGADTLETPDDWALLIERERPLARVFDGLMEHSNGFRVLARSLRPGAFSAAGAGAADVRATTPEAAPAPGGAHGGGKPRVPNERRKLVLEELLALCRAHGIQLIVIVPWYVEFEGHEAILRQFAAVHELMLVDLPLRLAGSERPRAEYFVDKVHPTAEGHGLIAREIAAAILERR